jgi:hypothetical protein
MVLDDEMLKKAQAAEARLADADKVALLARAEYNTVIRRIHLGGASLREIAAGLGLSHQRVQQVVDDAGGSWWKPRTRDAVCTFCGRPPSEVQKLIRGPNVFICDGCIALAEEVLSSLRLATKGGSSLTAAESGKASCSFCGNRRSDKRAMVLGPTSNVCDACVGLCRQIVDDSGPGVTPPSTLTATRARE